MRFEIGLILITGFIMANVWTEGKYLKKMLSYKKYYQMAGIAFGALMLYVLIKKNPSRANEMIYNSNEYLKYLPIDNATSSMITPILDFTTKQSFYDSGISKMGGGGILAAGGLMAPRPDNMIAHQTNKIMSSGKKSTKRSVSETKKKFVAASQNWKCGDCNKQLTAWFEVDHKIRLEYGGSNHIDNLVALCRECHGKKTTIENL